MRKLLFLFLLFLSSFSFAQNYHVLRGYVYNADNQPLSSVYVRVQHSNEGTVTNEDGQYEIRLEEGLNRISYMLIGFETQQIDVVMNSDQVKNIWMKESTHEIDGINVNLKKRDYSYEVIKNVIDNKWRYQDQYNSYKYNLYVKSSEQIKKRKKVDKERIEEVSFLSGKDSIPDLNLFEGKFIVHTQEPNKRKEIKMAAERYGSQTNLFYTSTTDADFNFYQNLLVIRKLGDNSYVSPFSPTTFLSYKFKLLGSYYEGDQKIYKIQVTPRKLGNALLKGTIEVYDSLWAIKEVDLSFPKSSLVRYDEFSIKQTYNFVDSIHIVEKQEFSWVAKTTSAKWLGNCMVRYDQFSFDSSYHKRFFNAELGRTHEDAYERDSGYWASIRPLPLSRDEQAFVQYQDSLKRYKNSKEYLDSIDSAFNSINLMKLTLYGMGYRNREKKVNWSFDPLINVLDPLAIGGWRVRYSVSYYKRFPKRKSISFTPFLNYGFLNQDFKGNINTSFLYNPKKRSRITLNAGRYFGFVNQFATIGDIIRRDNFYEQSYLYLNHRTELFNGFYLSIGARYVNRSDLGDFKFASGGDSLFENNTPILFPESTNFATSFGISYTPKQLYLQEPHEKIILGSAYPTFSLEYRRSWPGLLNANNQYEYGEFGIRQLFNIGTIGTSEYNFTIGKFFDTTALSVMDYKYQRGGDRYLFTPSMYTFQMIDSTFPTFNWFFEAHFLHQFNGFITSRVPGLRQTGIRSMAGAGFLYAPERDYQYSELFYGINRIFKLGRQRVRLGVYYVMAQSNDFGFRNGVKFSIEPYDASRNTWSF
ncbi:MAG: carboxypeptidase-like regulatory domain-containing protein [Bacteroidia bacterium]